MIVAPTEPPKLRAGNTVSMLPETYGCDVLWIANGRWYGTQRKEFGDLIASLADGRLGQQVAQMKDLMSTGGSAMLLVEGMGEWTRDGEWLGRGRGVTRQQFRGVLWSVQEEGVKIGMARDLDGTVEWLKEYEAWTRKAKHTGLMKRESARNSWGTAGSRDYARHLLMGLPGVGVEMADRVIEKFGRVPWRWDVTVEELMTVPGIGKKRAEGMMRALEDV